MVLIQGMDTRYGYGYGDISTFLKFRTPPHTVWHTGVRFLVKKNLFSKIPVGDARKTKMAASFRQSPCFLNYLEKYASEQKSCENLF